MSAFAAHLRVYEPLSAFPPAERRHWEAYASSRSVMGRSEGAALEHMLALEAAVQAPTTAGVPDVREHAFVLLEGGVPYLCPWRTQLRAWEALAEFRETFPEEVADAFVPRAAAEAAEAQYATWRMTHPDMRSHVRSSTWEVPLQWFVLVDGSERRLVLGPRQSGSVASAEPSPPVGREPSVTAERSLSYLTAMSRARRRVARGLAVLRRTIDDAGAIARLESLGRWLEEFHPRSFVEVDYGSLVHLLDDGDLAADESATDVNRALASLSAGDPTAAAAAYERVTRRMRTLASMESAN